MADIEHTNREVIQGKLLAALDDEGKVAAVLSEADVRLLIDALDVYNEQRHPDPMAVQMRDDLWQLKNEAF